MALRIIHTHYNRTGNSSKDAVHIGLMLSYSNSAINRGDLIEDSLRGNFRRVQGLRLAALRRGVGSIVGS